MKKLLSLLTLVGVCLAQSAAFAAALTRVATMQDLLGENPTLGTGVTKDTAYVAKDTVYRFTGNGAITGLTNTVIADTITNGSGNLVIAAWVNPTSTSGNSIFSIGLNTNGFKFDLKNGNLCLTTKHVAEHSISDTPVSANTWTLVAVSVACGKSGDQLSLSSGRFYVGDSICKTSNLGNMYMPVPTTFAIGSGNSEGLQDVFNGSIANLTVFSSGSSEVTNAEIADAMAGTQPTLLNFELATGLQQYYPFDGTIGASIYSLDPITLSSKGSSGDASTYTDRESFGKVLPAGNGFAYDADRTHFLPGTNDFTCAFWFKGTKTSGTSTAANTDLNLKGILTRGVSRRNDATGGNARGWGLFKTADGAVRLDIKETTSSAVNSIVSAAVFTDTEAWHHIAWTREGATVTLYVDGVSAGTATLSSADANINAEGDIWNREFSPGRAGGESDTVSTSEAMDDLAFWDYALDATEIATLQPQSLDATLSSYVGAYVLNDSSTKGDDGSIAWSTLGVDTSDALIEFFVTGDQTLKMDASASVAKLKVLGSGSLTITSADSAVLTVTGELEAGIKVAYDWGVVTASAIAIAKNASVEATSTYTEENGDTIKNGTNHACVLPPLTGEGMFVKKGSGILILRDKACEPLIDVQEGVLHLTEANNHTFINNFNITVAKDAWLRFTTWKTEFGNTATANQILLKGGANMVAANGNSIYAAITVDATDELPAKIYGSAWQNATLHSAITGQGALEFAAGQQYMSGYSCASPMTVSGVISDGLGGSLKVKVADTDGTVVTFSGTNTYTGGTEITNGAYLKVATVAQLGGTADRKAVATVNGTLEFTSTESVSEADTDLSGITGTGTIKYSGSGYRTLPEGAGKLFPSTLALNNEQTDGLIITQRGTSEEDPAITEIGTLSGSKGFRVDWGGAHGTHDRILCIKQSANSTYSGVMLQNTTNNSGSETWNRLKEVRIKGATGNFANETLTYTGDTGTSVPLVIEKTGSVDLASGSCWDGQITVYGRIGGQGYVQNDIIFMSGSVLDLSNGPLAYKKTVTLNDGVKINLGSLPTEETVVLDKTDITLPNTYKVSVNGVYDPFIKLMKNDEGKIVAVPTNPVANLERVQLAYNYCTLSYTMALWSEAEWEAEILRLKNAGFTHVLVNAGMEAVWYEFLTNLSKTEYYQADGVTPYFTDYTDGEARTHIPHPAWRAWWLMGNLEGEGQELGTDGYALTIGEIARQKRIGQAIVNKCWELGLTPVVNSFMGLMPIGFTGEGGKYPSLSALKNNEWTGYQRPDQLLPTDSRFPALAEAYHKALFEVYGITAEKSVAFSGDLFHEGGAKPSDDIQTASVIAVQEAQQAARPGAVWFIQHWHDNPTAAVQRGCDARATIIQKLDKSMCYDKALDEATYNGKNNEKLSWIWAEVTGFGDRTNMYGGPERMVLARQYLNDEISTKITPCIGWAMLDEGISYQPYYYNKMFDVLGKSADGNKQSYYTPSEADLAQLALATREDSQEAWALIMRSTFHPTNAEQEGPTEGVLCAEPYNSARGYTSTWGYKGVKYWNPADVRAAAQSLLTHLKTDAEGDNLLATDDAWREFYIDTMRQVLSDAFSYEDCRTLEVYQLMDDLMLRSNKLTLWHYWELAQELSRPVITQDDGTTSLGDVDNDVALKHYRAFLCLITTWKIDETDNSSGLLDYSYRHLGGLMVSHYGRRWEQYWNGEGQDAVRKADAAYYKSATLQNLPAQNITPTATDLIEIGEAILAVVPEVLTWTGATDNTWTGANWTSKKYGTTEVTWTDDADVIFTGTPSSSILIEEMVTVHNLQVKLGAITGENTRDWGANNNSQSITTDDTQTTDLGWSDLTIADLLAASYTGYMGGEWIGASGNGIVVCDSYYVELSDANTVTLQMHAEDDDSVKVVGLEISLIDGQVKAKQLWRSTASSLGDRVTGGSKDSKYCIRGLSLQPRAISSVTLSGNLTVTDSVLLEQGSEISASGLATIPQVKMAGMSATLALGDAQNLTIQNLDIPAGGKLIVKGSASTLPNDTLGLTFVDAEGTPYHLPTETVYYVCTSEENPVEQELMTDSDGRAIVVPKGMDNDIITSTPVETGWTGWTLAELSHMVFTGKMGAAGSEGAAARGYTICIVDNALSVIMKATDQIDVELRFTVDDAGAVSVSAPNVATDATTGVFGLAIASAAASILTTEGEVYSTYAHLDDALADVVEGYTVKLLVDDNTTLTIGTAMTLDLNGYTLSGDVTFNAATTLKGTGTLSGALSGSGNVTIDSSATIHVSQLWGYDASRTITIEGTLNVSNTSDSELSTYGDYTGEGIIRISSGMVIFGNASDTGVTTGLSDFTGTLELAKDVTVHLTNWNSSAYAVSLASLILGENAKLDFTNYTNGCSLTVAELSGPGSFTGGGTFAFASDAMIAATAGTPQVTGAVTWPTTLTVKLPAGTELPKQVLSGTSLTAPAAAVKTTVYVGDVETTDYCLQADANGLNVVLGTAKIVVDGVTTSYASVADAIVGASDDATIDVVASVNETFAIDKDVTLNVANGGTLQGTINIPEGKTLTVSVAEGGTLGACTITGAGTLISNIGLSTNFGGLTDATKWTGTFEFGALVNDATLTAYGNANSKIRFTGTFTSDNAYFGTEGDTLGFNCVAEFILDGSIKLTNGYSRRDYTFAKLSGRGSFMLVDKGETGHEVKDAFVFTDTTDFTGNLRASTYRSIQIGTGAAVKNTMFVFDNHTLETLDLSDGVKLDIATGKTLTVTHLVLGENRGFFGWTADELPDTTKKAQLVIADGGSVTLTEGPIESSPIVVNWTMDTSKVTVSLIPLNNKVDAEKYPVLMPGSGITVDADGNLVFDTTLTGKGCWYEWLFDAGTLASTGRVQHQYSQLGTELGENYDLTNYYISAPASPTGAERKALKLSAKVLQDHLDYSESLEAPNWSSSFFARMPSNEGGVLVSFGSAPRATKGSLALVRGKNENQVVLVYIREGSTTCQVLADMKVPHAETDYHLYSFVKYADHIEIFLDEKLWTTVQGDFSVSTGIKMGGLYYYQWSDGSQTQEELGTYTADVNGGRITLVGAADITDDDTPGAIDMLRIYDCYLTLDEVSRIAAEYPYESPYGEFERTISTATVNWNDASTWTKTLEGETSLVAYPTDGVATLTATTATTVTVNMSEAAELEGLTLTGAAITLSAGTETKHITVTGSTLIETDVNVDCQAISFEGPVEVVSGKTLTLTLTDALLTKWGTDYITNGLSVTKNLTGYITMGAAVGETPAATVGVVVPDVGEDGKSWTKTTDDQGVITFTKDNFILTVKLDTTTNCWTATLDHKAWTVTIATDGTKTWELGDAEYTPTDAETVFLKGAAISIVASADATLTLNGTTKGMTITKGEGVTGDVTVTLLTPTNKVFNYLQLNDLSLGEGVTVVLAGDVRVTKQPTKADGDKLMLAPQGTLTVPAGDVGAQVKATVSPATGYTWMPAKADTEAGTTTYSLRRKGFMLMVK